MTKDRLTEFRALMNQHQEPEVRLRKKRKLYF